MDGVREAEPTLRQFGSVDVARELSCKRARSAPLQAGVSSQSVDAPRHIAAYHVVSTSSHSSGRVVDQMRGMVGCVEQGPLVR